MEDLQNRSQNKEREGARAVMGSKNSGRNNAIKTGIRTARKLGRKFEELGQKFGDIGNGSCRKNWGNLPLPQGEGRGYNKCAFYNSELNIASHNENCRNFMGGAPACRERFSTGMGKIDENINSPSPNGRGQGEGIAKPENCETLKQVQGDSQLLCECHKNTDKKQNSTTLYAGLFCSPALLFFHMKRIKSG